MGYESEVGIKEYSTEECAAFWFGLSINSEWDFKGENKITLIPLNEC